MKRSTGYALATVALLATGIAAGAPALGQDKSSPPPAGGAMNDDQMMGGGMKKMMARMNAMMDRCEKMMEAQTGKRPKMKH